MITQIPCPQEGVRAGRNPEEDLSFLFYFSVEGTEAQSGAGLSHKGRCEVDMEL